MSSINELSKQGKIQLIKSIQSGEVSPDQLTHESVIISNGKEAFAGLMISVANHKAGNKSPVVYVGEAKTLMEECLENIQSRRNEH